MLLLALALIGLLSRQLWLGVMVKQFIFCVIVTVIFWLPLLRRNTGAAALLLALASALPLSSISLATIVFVRCTSSLSLLSQLVRIGNWRWLRQLMIMTALVLLFFPLIAQQFEQRRLNFLLRGGKWWPLWRSLPPLLAPLLLLCEQNSVRRSEALMLRGLPENWTFAAVKPLRLVDWLVLIIFIIVLFCSRIGLQASFA